MQYRIKNLRMENGNFVFDMKMWGDSHFYKYTLSNKGLYVDATEDEAFEVYDNARIKLAAYFAKKAMEV